VVASRQRLDAARDSYLLLSPVLPSSAWADDEVRGLDLPSWLPSRSPSWPSRRCGPSSRSCSTSSVG